MRIPRHTRRAATVFAAIAGLASAPLRHRPGQPFPIPNADTPARVGQTSLGALPTLHSPVGLTAGQSG